MESRTQFLLCKFCVFFFSPLKELEFGNSKCCLRELDINKIESFVIFLKKFKDNEIEFL